MIPPNCDEMGLVLMLHDVDADYDAGVTDVNDDTNVVDPNVAEC